MTICEDCEHMHDHVTSHAKNARNFCHLAGATARKGSLSEQDIMDIRMARAWCNAILEGRSLDAGDVYNEAFGEKAA